VLALDLDPQAHLTLGLQIPGDDRPAEQTVAALFHRGGNIIELMVETCEPNLKVLPASIRLARAAESFYAVLFREGKVREGLLPVKQDLDYVILDCPPNLGVLTVNALTAATHVLIPTQLSMYSLDGMSDLLDTMMSVKQDVADWDWRVLLTMVSGHAGERNQTAAKLLEPLSDRILKTHIHRTEAIERSQMRDDQTLAAVVLDRTSNRGARDYRNLVKEIATLWPAR
jgi:chromosome partitioning protein